MQRDIREGMRGWWAHRSPSSCLGESFRAGRELGEERREAPAPLRCAQGTQSSTQRAELTVSPGGGCAKGNGPWSQRGRELSRAGKNCHACPSVCFKTSHELVCPKIMWGYRNMWRAGSMANRATCATQLFLPSVPAGRTVFSHGGTCVWHFTS